MRAPVGHMTAYARGGPRLKPLAAADTRAEPPAQVDDMLARLAPPDAEMPVEAQAATDVPEEAPAPDHPQAPLASSPASVMGFVDGLDGSGAITGWACLPTAPTLRVKVSVVDGDEIVTSTLANLLRPDIAQAGHSDGWSGFALPLPQRLFDNCQHALLVRCDVPDTEPFAAEPFIIEMQVKLSASPARAGGAASLPALSFAPPARGAESPAETYVPGQFVMCRASFPRPIYHTRGWHDPEPDFTWIAGIEGEIEMAIRRPHLAYTFTLDVMPNGVSGRPQTLQVFFNYLCVGLFEVATSQTIAIELPSELFFLRKTRINLHCRQAVLGTDHGAADSRRLGIAVRNWCIG